MDRVDQVFHGTHGHWRLSERWDHFSGLCKWHLAKRETAEPSGDLSRPPSDGRRRL